MPRRGARGRLGGTDGGAQVRHGGARGWGRAASAAGASRGGPGLRSREADGERGPGWGLCGARAWGDDERRRGPDPWLGRPPAAGDPRVLYPPKCPPPAAGTEGGTAAPQAAELCRSNFPEPGPWEPLRRLLRQLGAPEAGGGWGGHTCPSRGEPPPVVAWEERERASLAWDRPLRRVRHCRSTDTQNQCAGSDPDLRVCQL